MRDLQLADRVAEIPYRLRSPSHAEGETWPLAPEDLARISVMWPTKYQWAPSGIIVETIRDGMTRLGVLRLEPTAQTLRGVVMLTCVVDDRPHVVALDYADYQDAVNDQALSECALYIKCQFREGGYANSKIVPGGYTVTTRAYYRYFMRLRKQLNPRPTIGVLARFGYLFQGELRRQAVDLLTQTPDIHCVGNNGKVRYSRFLREVAGARLSLHMPGNGPFTHRVAEFLGLGTCLVSQRFATSLHVALKPGVHYVEIAPDMSDLVDKVRYYLANENERKLIANAGTEYFDRFLHSEQLVQYYIRTMLDRLGTIRTRA
jgi:hypothetical protein